MIVASMQSVNGFEATVVPHPVCNIKNVRINLSAEVVEGFDGADEVDGLFELQMTRFHAMQLRDQLNQLDLSDQEIDFCLVCELEHEVDHPHFSQGATSFR